MRGQYGNSERLGRRQREAVRDQPCEEEQGAQSALYNSIWRSRKTIGQDSDGKTVDVRYMGWTFGVFTALGISFDQGGPERRRATTAAMLDGVGRGGLGLSEYGG